MWRWALTYLGITATSAHPLFWNRVGEPVPTIDPTMSSQAFWSLDPEPRVFRRAFSPPEWDEANLRHRFGWVEAKIEPKHERRGRAPPPRHRATLAELLDSVDDEYAVSILPHAMAAEIPMLPQIPSSLRLTELGLWVAHGHTRSQLHYDREHQIHCAVRGTKVWQFIDTQRFAHRMQWVNHHYDQASHGRNSRGSDWIDLDPDHVDLDRYPEFADLPFQRVVQRPGDCLYVPAQWLHQVNASADAEFVVSITYAWVDPPSGSFTEPAATLADMDVLWFYSGKGVIPQGYADPLEEVRDPLLQMFDTEFLTEEAFHGFVQDEFETLDWESAAIAWERLAAHATIDPKRGLHRSEVAHRIPLDDWLVVSTLITPRLDCDVGESYVPRSMVQSNVVV